MTRRHERRRGWWALIAPLVAVVGLVAASTAAAGAAATIGSDISWPQCGQSYPATPAFGIVGVTDGRPDTTNPCLVSEYRWAKASASVEFYLNTANPDLAPTAAYNYGYAAAKYAYSAANSEVKAATGHLWWLDVETGNTWSADQGANTEDIAGSIAFFRAKGVQIGLYSTQYQWGLITGGASVPSAANWVPGASSAAQATSFCAAGRSFSGGPVVMTQYTTRFDYDALCPGVSLPPALAPPTNPIASLLTSILAWLRGK